MKKLFLFAVAALAMAACSNDELNVQDNVQSSLNKGAVNFDVYAQRGKTRAGIDGTNDNANIGTRGFGVFAYYTAGEVYDTKATPNFMYNQKVTANTSADNPASASTKWSYEPVKYWPNEFGAKAMSDETDYVTFFAYAPWTNIEPTTGVVIPDPNKDLKKEQTLNIISVNKNTATGDPLIKYVVDTDPATSVDLLWGVAAEDANKVYTPIDATGNSNVEIKAGLPFLSLVKPNNPQDDRLMFNLKHALAKVKVTIDYIADDFTPGEGPLLDTPVEINADQTRIYVRNFKMSGFAMKGALNLNNTTPGEPLWKDFDGAKDLSFDDITFQDGRKDGKEGETNGAQNNETPQGLNPNIIENWAQIEAAKDAVAGQGNEGDDDYVAPQPAEPAKFGAAKTPGVTKDPQLLFGGTLDDNGGLINEGFFYVIPRNEQGNKVDITIAYDVETIDPALAGKLSDGETHGISIENVITKEDIFKGMDFRAGYQYEINIHLGMTSVKVEATVTDWKDNGKTDVELPDNQEPYFDTYWTIGDDENTHYTSDPTMITAPEVFYVKDAASWRDAVVAGPLAAYYDANPTEAVAAPDDPTIANNGFIYTDKTGVKHTWHAEVIAPKDGHDHDLPWVVINMKYDPVFNGVIHMEYNGNDNTPWGADAKDFTKGYAICAVSDNAFENGGISPFTNYNDYTYGTELTGTTFDFSKLTVKLERKNVTEHSYRGE